ncbi:CopG family ribbon-helix-helix protein [Sphingomonas sp. NFR15]|uniref:CopG family ribbon-helix-helix protein n=1 Tax=Sphingomonas sp. NFR15 TaxID=1566282 RepID=UPI0008923614|nr:ribbon-helix-helix protein, CopG family [Sphingomonas sp. NFR15]SDA36527.1 Predicted transcriptional regulator [Sphingomonas sp. NFR15]
MSKTAVVTTRLDPDTIDLIDRVTAARGQSRSKFIARAVVEAARREAEFLAFVQEGIDQLDRGEGIPHEEVKAKLDALIAKHEARCRV